MPLRVESFNVSLPSTSPELHRSSTNPPKPLCRARPCHPQASRSTSLPSESPYVGLCIIDLARPPSPSQAVRPPIAQP
ncbi:hypothetical protein GUJ93_ZPchr0003g17396 [Zizania palustris]|uniref:Uncharacterized protein n=1 Tax=Zizania palustris TaxID=103762 RepID=A0A8J5RLL2_ZIZPA|nr:hypothetical protein GUJ93_ZPchr0003g17396 [Zizania palustris]